MSPILGSVKSLWMCWWMCWCWCDSVDNVGTPSNGPAHVTCAATVWREEWGGSLSKCNLLSIKQLATFTVWAMLGPAHWNTTTHTLGTPAATQLGEYQSINTSMTDTDNQTSSLLIQMTRWIKLYMMFSLSITQDGQGHRAARPATQDTWAGWLKAPTVQIRRQRRDTCCVCVIMANHSELEFCCFAKKITLKLSQSHHYQSIYLG